LLKKLLPVLLVCLLAALCVPALAAEGTCSRCFDTYAWFEVDAKTCGYGCGRCNVVLRTRVHIAEDCAEPGLCMYCGADGVDCLAVTCSCDREGYFKVDEFVCAHGCPYWNYTHRSFHYGDCDKTNLCKNCGAADVQCKSYNHTCNAGYSRLDEKTCGKVCPNTGVVFSKRTHSADCGSPDVCRWCGADDVKIETVEHSSCYSGYAKVDEFTCGEVCKNTGEVFRKDAHYAYCDKPDTCRRCGSKGVQIGRIDHSCGKEGYSKVDENTCGYGCPNMGYTQRTQPHTASCATPDTCTNCGAQNVTCELDHGDQHGGERYPVYLDETYHLMVCGVCDTPMQKACHYAGACNEPETCWCGAHIEGLKAVFHTDYDYVKEWGWFDDEYHYAECLVCDKLINKQAHKRYCDQTQCLFCDYDGQGIVAEHSYESSYTHPAGIDLGNGTHEITCYWCGETQIEPHSNGYDCWLENTPTDTKCNLCPAENIPLQKNHYFTGWRCYSDESFHWDICELCQEVANITAHYTDPGDPEGICSHCLAVYEPEAENGDIIVGLEALDRLQPVKKPTLAVPEGTVFDTGVFLKYRELAVGSERIVYDVKLVDRNGTEVEVPEGSVLIFPYPESITLKNAVEYLFTIVHHLLPDDEIFTTLEDTVFLKRSGLCVKVDTLSPFEILWAKQADLPPTGDGARVGTWLALMVCAGVTLTRLKKKTA